MKKKILILCLICGALLYAETGYKGIEWYSTPEDVGEKLLTNKTADPLKKENIKTWHGAIQVTQKDKEDFYFFRNDDFLLEGIVKPIREEQIKQVQKTYKLIKKAKTNTIIEYQYLNTFTEDEKNYIRISNICSTAQAIERLENSLFKIYVTHLLEGEKGISKGKTCTISKYDYNNDTSLYLFENYYPGENYVVFIPHEQDY